MEVETRLQSQQIRNLRFHRDDLNPVEVFLRTNKIEIVHHVASIAGIKLLDYVKEHGFKCEFIVST